MSAEQPDVRSFWWTVRHGGKVWQWPIAYRCAVCALIVLPLATVYWVPEYTMLRHPEFAPYVDQDFLRQVFPIHVVFYVGWLLILGLAVWGPTRLRDSQLLAHVTAQWFAIGFALMSYWLGHHTTPYFGVVLLGGAAFGFLLLDRGPMVWAVASGLFVFGSTAVAEQVGFLRYAPLLRHAPFAAGRLETSWLVTYGAASLAVFFVVLGLLYRVCYGLRRSEDELALASAQLARANDVISRYVASQLAQQILAGNYEGITRHERRKLTLFFSDIKDFSETADRVEPEDLSAVLNEYLAEMARIGERYGGTIDKFVGDAVMIFFGAPDRTDDRDHALRAVAMAIDMQRRMVELRRKWLDDGFERPFEVRIGINTGQATIGPFGSEKRVDYTAIGRQVNLAARLQAQCEPGRILISHSTWVLVQSRVTCIPKGEVKVKGIGEPVRVYEIAEFKETELGEPA
jgi:class 3 adenylate cyclase